MPGVFGRGPADGFGEHLVLLGQDGAQVQQHVVVFDTADDRRIGTPESRGQAVRRGGPIRPGGRTMCPACGPPSSLSPENATSETPAATLAWTIGSRASP